MNRGQRGIHKWIWLLMAVIIPVMIFMALSGISYVRADHKNEMVLKQNGSSLVIEKEGFSTAIVTENDRSRLVIRLNRPLKNPSALVYTIDKNGSKDLLLGQLAGVGDYSFDIPTEINGILFYDKIKDVEIEKLVFSWD